MVDTLVSGASASRRVGSTPISGTILRAQRNPLSFIYIKSVSLLRNIIQRQL